MLTVGVRSAVSRIQLDLKSIHADVLDQKAAVGAGQPTATITQITEVQEARQTPPDAGPDGLSIQEVEALLVKALMHAQPSRAAKDSPEQKIRDILELVRRKGGSGGGGGLPAFAPPAFAPVSPPAGFPVPPRPVRRAGPSPQARHASARTVVGGLGMPTVTFTARHRGPVLCRSPCGCACHLSAVPQVRVRSALLGVLFVGYSGYPVARSACTEAACLERGRTSIEVHYVFPLWFLPLTVSAVFQHTAAGGPKLGLVVRQMAGLMPGSIANAVRNSDVPGLQALLRADPDAVNARLEGYGWSMLHTAVRIGASPALVAALLRAGADPDQEDDQGANAGIAAAERVLSLRCPPPLAALFADVFPLERYVDDLELSHLAQVIVGIRPGTAAALLGPAGGAVTPGLRAQLDARDRFGYTPLYWAVARGDVATVRALLAAGADPNVRLENGQTVLCCALERASAAASEACVAALLDAGADPAVRDDFGYDAFLWACRANHLPFVRRRVAELGDGVVDTAQTATPHVPALAVACNAAGRADVVRFLLGRGADVEARDGHGNTVLENAVFKNSGDCIRAVLAAGADYRHVTAAEGWTLLHLAAVVGKAETLGILAAHGLAGVDAWARDRTGATAAELFARRGGVDGETASLWKLLVDTVERAEAGGGGEEEDVFYDAEEWRYYA